MKLLRSDPTTEPVPIAVALDGLTDVVCARLVSTASTSSNEARALELVGAPRYGSEEHEAPSLTRMYKLLGPVRYPKPERWPPGPSWHWLPGGAPDPPRRSAARSKLPSQACELDAFLLASVSTSSRSWNRRQSRHLFTESESESRSDGFGVPSTRDYPAPSDDELLRDYIETLIRLTRTDSSDAMGRWRARRIPEAMRKIGQAYVDAGMPSPPLVEKALVATCKANVASARSSEDAVDDIDASGDAILFDSSLEQLTALGKGYATQGLERAAARNLHALFGLLEHSIRESMPAAARKVHAKLGDVLRELERAGLRHGGAAEEAGRSWVLEQTIPAAIACVTTLLREPLKCGIDTHIVELVRDLPLSAAHDQTDAVDVALSPLLLDVALQNRLAHPPGDDGWERRMVREALVGHAERPLLFELSGEVALCRLAVRWRVAHEWLRRRSWEAEVDRRDAQERLFEPTSLEPIPDLFGLRAPEDPRLDVFASPRYDLWLHQATAWASTPTIADSYPHNIDDVRGSEDLVVPALAREAGRLAAFASTRARPGSGLQRLHSHGGCEREYFGVCVSGDLRVVVLEHDGSRRLLRLTDRGYSEADVWDLVNPEPVARALVHDAIADLLRCASCLGGARQLGREHPRCGDCGGTGSRREAHDITALVAGILRLALEPYVAWGGSDLQIHEGVTWTCSSAAIREAALRIITSRQFP